MDFKKATERVMADSRYKKNIEYGKARPGHPEGKVKHHIADLEANLEQLKHHLQNEKDYWKLKFLIHVHDTFKAEAVGEGVPSTNSNSHESLARAFASEFIDDADLLNILQYHDENYALWKQFKNTGSYDKQWLELLLSVIKDWDLFLTWLMGKKCAE